MHTHSLSRLWCLIVAIAFFLGIASLSHAAVSGEWRVNLLRGSQTQQPASTGATQEAAVAACIARIPQSAPQSTTYTCQPARYVATVTPNAPPPPPPPSCTTPRPSDQTRPQACPSGTMGTWEQSISYTSADYPTCWVAVPWLPSSPPEGSCTPVIEPPPPAPGESVGTWAQRNFSQAFRLSMEPGSYPVWVAGGATHVNLAGAWDGSRFARITPPTSEQTYGGIGSFALPSGVSTLSLRWEMRAGPTFASGGQGFVDNKHVIIHAAGGNRAMMNIQQAPGNCLQMAIAQGTVKQFNQSSVGGIPVGLWRGENNDLFRWCDTASHAKAIPAGEWLSIELQVSCGTSLHSSGHIRAIVHRRSSSRPVADWWIPWNYDSNARCGNFTGVEGIGDYYNGRGNGAPGTYFDLAGVTFATNRTSPLGPRAGFVLE